VKTLGRKTMVCGLSAAVMLLSALTGCGGEKGKKTGGVANKKADSAFVKVVTADIHETAFEDWGDYSADLRGYEDAVLIAPYQGGRVNSVKPVGTSVKAGEGLCDIDGDKYDAALEAAQAQVDVTKGDMERAKANVEKGSLGRSVLDGTNLAYQNARMMLATAKRANEDCHCQSPFDGIVVSRTIEKYQSISPGAPTVRVSRLDRLEAVIAIPETEAFSYKEGMKTQFHLLQHPEQSYEGKLTSLDRAVDVKSRTVLARIVVTNKNNMLKPGMVGRASILRRNYDKAIVIPSTALLRLQAGICVMVVENGIARQRKVSIGATTADSTFIADGLNAGDKLIVTGAFQVSDGTKVSF